MKDLRHSFTFFMQVKLWPHNHVRVETYFFLPKFFYLRIGEYLTTMIFIDCASFIMSWICPFSKKTKRIIYKQIEGFCIDTFENSAFQNVVTYHESFCLFSPFCNEQDEIRHAATDRIQYWPFG